MKRTEANVIRDALAEVLDRYTNRSLNGRRQQRIIRDVLQALGYKEKKKPVRECFIATQEGNDTVTRRVSPIPRTGESDEPNRDGIVIGHPKK
jgi:hypothetical protein